MSNKKLTFNDFKARELPKRIADAKYDEMVQVSFSITGLEAKAVYSSLGDPGKYFQHCLRETVYREGGMFTVDGIVSADEIARQLQESGSKKQKKVSGDEQNISGSEQ